MRRIRITVGYDGTNYHGWQVQPGLPTIQGVIKSVLSEIESGEVKVEGSGRTVQSPAEMYLRSRIACCLPNIYEEAQLREFAAASESPALTREELDRVAELAANNFGIADEVHNYKGTMTRETAAA